jgi:pyruvate kinase
MTHQPTDAPQAAATRLAQRLHDELTEIRSAVCRDGDAHMEQWLPRLKNCQFVASARNLAHYLSLRQFDLRDMQPALASLGLSTLGRSEAHVLPTLDAVLGALARIAHLPDQAFPPGEDFAAGRDALEQRQLQVFGEDPEGPYTRIMVTLPSEAATDSELVRQLIAEGADCVRINCAHDSAEAWLAMIVHARAAAQALDRDVRVLMDIAGPKIRIAGIACDEKKKLFAGDRFILTDSPSPKPKLPELTLSHSSLLDHIAVGSALWIDDGKIGAHVVSKEGRRAVLEVTQARDKGEKLKPGKGINLPGVDLDIPALTEEDIACLDFVAGHADIVGYSFVQTPQDVRRLVDELSTRMNGKPLPALMLKIETPLAVRNLPRLIVQAGGQMPVAVMIARGDLAVEIGMERLSEIQEEILWLCEAAHVPVVWATQVLDNLLKEGAASRAETTDAAMSQRAECVMLNKGPYLAMAVAFLDRILRRMDRHQAKKSPRLGPLQSWRGPQPL